jgi:serine/threonine protein kinase
MDNTFHPHLFGRYVIIDPIAEGGMAEVYRARLSAQGGPNRIIIIKKIKEKYSADPDFVEMFESEIKLTSGLTHPNIIQTYDYGRVDGQLYSALEYVQGENLDQVVNKLAESGTRLDTAQICFIIGQVCQALSFAHAYQDPVTGETNCIVHRDVSPQNIMISFSGAVKLFDYGIAKSLNSVQKTSVGVIKGKPSYLSPEQAQSQPIDGRSDIFAIGIILWELFTGQRLFRVEDENGNHPARDQRANSSALRLSPSAC